MTAICARSDPHLRHMRRGLWPERRADGASKLKLATWSNAAGMFVVAVLAAFASVSTEARAMLVYSYYSDQIIITTDEWRSGPVDLPPEVGPSIAACWRAPPTGSKIRNPRGWVPTETGTGGLTPTPCREQFIGSVRPVLQRGSWIGWAMRLAEVGFFVLPEIVHVEIAVGFEPVFVGLEARARTRRRHASALGKIRTTWVRRLIFSLRRSGMVVLLRCLWCCRGSL